MNTPRHWTHQTPAKDRAQVSRPDRRRLVFLAAPAAPAGGGGAADDGGRVDDVRRRQGSTDAAVWFAYELLAAAADATLAEASE